MERVFRLRRRIYPTTGAKSRAKFKKGEVSLRTEMRIKERWKVREKGTETVEEEN